MASKSEPVETGADADAPDRERGFAALRDALGGVWHALLIERDVEQAVARFRIAQTLSHGFDGIRAARRAGATRDLLAREIEAFEAEARAILANPDLEPELLADGLALLRAQSRILLRITRGVEGLPLWEESPFQLIELQEIENGLDEAAGIGVGAPGATGIATDDPERSVREAVREIRLDLFERNARQLLDRSAAIASHAGQDLPEVFDLYHRLVVLRRELHQRLPHGGMDGLKPLIERLAGEERRLQELLFTATDQVSSHGELRAITLVAARFTGALDAARMSAYEQRHGVTVEELRGLQAAATRFARSYERQQKRLGVPARESMVLSSTSRRPRPRRVVELRRLKRMTRRIGDLIADRILKRRLEGLFGRRLVAAWETLIFWLIIAVLGLIVVDHYATPAADDRVDWTVFIDTAICCVLLLDFGVRLALAPTRLRFLWRHFLTDLLPALPWSLLANLDRLATTGSAGLLRWVRVFRLLRLAQPIVRLFRLMLFVARAADRLVLRNAWLLNRNIIFFAEAAFDDDAPTQLKRARELDSWVNRTTAELFRQLSPECRLRSAAMRARLVRMDLDGAPPSDRLVSIVDRQDGSHARDIDVDEVIRHLRELEGNQVAQLVGLEFAQQLTDSMRFFRLPLVRRLPAVRYVLGASGVPDPLRTTARVGRILGDLLETAQRAITWFADLHGTITGPQFLDRVGMQLVKATQRPAKRLILFGVIVGLVMLIVKLIHLPFLNAFAVALLKFLSLPVLVLGGICLVPLLLGSWFRKIAGQAADFYDRVAEAQFLSLTETAKERHHASDLAFLSSRVLLPEATLRHASGGVDASVIERSIIERFSTREQRDEPAPGGLDWSLHDMLLLFYRDFLDGSFFHKSDTKVANMLLGNVTLENIRLNRLQFSKKRMKRLERIDIGRGKGGVAGAYVWFHSITHAVAQQTARLIIEYNQHCIPCDERAAAAPIDQRLFDEWLTRRLAASARTREVKETWIAPPTETLANADGTLAYRTTEFNALHFLTADPVRDTAIERRYGASVYRLLAEDRENLVRMIFGTFPMQELPKERRTFNPYEFYRAYFARGRVFLFPLVTFGFVARGVRLLVRRVIDIIRDVIDPDTRIISETRGCSNFEIARRKIHRMRRPVVMEAVRLRADFDLMYLGVPLPGRDAPDTTRHGLAADLRALNASEREWEEFRNVKSRREGHARLLATVFRMARAQGKDFEDEMRTRNPRLIGRETEALRAAATAFVCDHEHVRSVTGAFEDLRAAVKRLDTEAVGARRLRTPTPRRRRVTRLVRSVWPRIARGDLADADLRRVALTETTIHEQPDLERAMKVLLDHLPANTDPYEYAYERLLEVGEQPWAWTEQIIALRTVQSLGMLDLMGYERMVAELGNYQDFAGGTRFALTTDIPHL